MSKADSKKVSGKEEELQEGLKELPTNAVKLLTRKYTMRNPVTGVVYNTHTPLVCADIEAPEALFERTQLAADVLYIVK